MFGPHLTLDLYGCDEKKLSDIEFITKILNDLPDLINMTKISSPQVTKYDGNPKSFDRGGLSGFVLIAESHITIHTFTSDKFASVDIFSCKRFDIKKVENFLIESLRASKVEKNYIIRGKDFVKHYPTDLAKVKTIVKKERKLIH